MIEFPQQAMPSTNPDKLCVLRLQKVFENMEMLCGGTGADFGHVIPKNSHALSHHTTTPRMYLRACRARARALVLYVCHQRAKMSHIALTLVQAQAGE
jgi:hypothetical protein